MELSIYESLANQFKPMTIHTVLLAESPPIFPDDGNVRKLKYFYNPDFVDNLKDVLLRETAKVILNRPRVAIRSKEDKIELLKAIQRKGYFLIDAVKYPINHLTPTERKKIILDSVPTLIQELKNLKPEPERIIILMKTIYDLTAEALTNAGLPVVPVVVYSPFNAAPKGFDYKTTLRKALNYVQKADFKLGCN
ncbi:MAG: hypothetical protein GX075_11595 [Firmicutes bacterium]|nr:hypothetical protein [Bacillota bacterium]